MHATPSHHKTEDWRGKLFGSVGRVSFDPPSHYLFPNPSAKNPFGRKYTRPARR